MLPATTPALRRHTDKVKSSPTGTKANEIVSFLISLCFPLPVSFSEQFALQEEGKYGQRGENSKANPIRRDHSTESDRTWERKHIPPETMALPEFCEP